MNAWIGNFQWAFPKWRLYFYCFERVACSWIVHLIKKIYIFSFHPFLSSLEENSSLLLLSQSFFFISFSARFNTKGNLYFQIIKISNKMECYNTLEIWSCPWYLLSLEVEFEILCINYYFNEVNGVRKNLMVLVTRLLTIRLVSW